MTQYQIKNARGWADHKRRGAALAIGKRVTRFVRGLFTPWAIGFLILCAVIAAVWK